MPDFRRRRGEAARALGEFRIAGVATNIAFLQALLRHPDVVAGRIDTRFVEEHACRTSASGGAGRIADSISRRRPKPTPATRAIAHEGPEGDGRGPRADAGQSSRVDVADGDALRTGPAVAVLEAMKMEHLVAAPCGGIVRESRARQGDTLFEGDPLAVLEPAERRGEARGATRRRSTPTPSAPISPRCWRGTPSASTTTGPTRWRGGARPASARRARTSPPSVDPGSFIEYGALAFAAQRRAATLDDLINNTPGDGIVTGIGTSTATVFAPERARCCVMAYDYTVLAGTQGALNHQKKDRMLKVAEEWQLPVVCFAEGGGGRPGDTDVPGVAGLDTPTFRQFAKLSRPGAARRHQSRAAASPAMRRCSAAATSSSPRRIRTSAWAARR